MGKRHPPKRLVSKGQYAKASVQKFGLYSSAACVLCLGMIGVAGAVVGVISGVVLTHRVPDNRLIPIDWRTLLCSLLIGGMSCGLLKFSKLLSAQGNAIELGAPINDANAHLLPPEKSLVRASEAPSSSQQAELLRAAQQGPETPAEHLLRPSGKQ